MYTIVGLGNPGAEYARTRHNAGVIAARAFADAHGFRDFVASGKFAGLMSEGTVGTADVRILLPTTFMNKSGASVTKVMADGVSPEELIVLHDELDIPLGTFKVSTGRGNAGHNGVRSIIDALDTNEFVRVRIGISPVSFFGKLKRPTGERVGDFVLKNFSRNEEAKLKALLPEINNAIEIVLRDGVEQAMQKYN